MPLFLLHDLTSFSLLCIHHSFASLPQKDAAGNPRTEAEEAAFKRGLAVMGACYASVVGTAVLQQRTVLIPPGAATGQGGYNPTPYEGEGGRGWCIFEQGVCMTVLAHLTMAERRAAEQSITLPDRLVRAQASRPKVIDISIGLEAAAEARVCEHAPKAVLDEACEAIERARFTGKADKQVVPQMLNEFEWVVRKAFTTALEDHASSGATVQPKVAASLLRGSRRLSARAPSGALLASQDAPHSHLQLHVQNPESEAVLRQTNGAVPVDEVELGAAAV